MGIFRREDKKVRETVELYANGMISKDIDMLMSLIVLDEDFLVIEQDPYEKVIGAKNYIEYMKEYFRMAHELDIEIDWMFLSVVDNMAWANTEMTFHVTKGSEDYYEQRSLTFIMEKRRGDWYIVHIMSSTIFIEEHEENEDVSDDTEVYEFENKDIDIRVADDDDEPENEEEEEET